MKVIDRIGTKHALPLLAVSLGLFLCLWAVALLVESNSVLARPVAEMSAASTPVPSAQGTGDEACLACHSNRDMTTTLPNGEKLSLYVDAATLSQSIHGEKVACTNCHVTITGYPHPALKAATRRDYSIVSYELCKQCHFANYTKTLDSVHFAVLASGHQEAPLCTDCHGAHDVAHPDLPRARISQTCAKCHQEIYGDYASSVHGRALQEENNQDVPTCTDCHGVHNIHDPRTAAFRLDTPEMCANCHSNEALMAKYGLSSKVLQTYLQDFHGVTVEFYRMQSPNIWSYKAVCTDCHGIHDIKATDDPESSVIKANLVSTCRKCHPDATENFPAAWLRHYDPSPTRAPIAYYVKLFYAIIIPLTVSGLLLHILLDLWRVTAHWLQKARTR